MHLNLLIFGNKQSTEQRPRPPLQLKHALQSVKSQVPLNQCLSLLATIFLQIWVVANDRFGLPAKGLETVVPENLLPAWYWTDMYSGELIYHERMLNHKCRTLDPNEATRFFIPFNVVVAVNRYLFTECLLGSVPPCVIYNNVERIGSAPGAFANHCLPYTGLHLIGNSLFGWNCLAPWFSYPSRNAIRRKFNLESRCEAFTRSCGCCGSFIEDDVQREQCESACDLDTHVFCHLCAICQEAREVCRRVPPPYPGFNVVKFVVGFPQPFRRWRNRFVV